MPRTATLRKSVVHWRGQPQRFPYLLIFPSPFYSTESFHISSPLSTILISNRGELKIFNYEKRRIVNYLFELYIWKKNWIGGGDEEVWFALARWRNMVGLVLRWWLGWIRDASFTHRLSPVHVWTRRHNPESGKTLIISRFGSLVHRIISHSDALHQISPWKSRRLERRRKRLERINFSRRRPLLCSPTLPIYRLGYILDRS